MSLAKSKNDFSKRDMNFFSEFNSAASQNFSSAFPFFLLLALSILVITLVIWIVCNFSIMKKTNRKNKLQADMASADYIKKLSDKDTIQVEVNKLQEYQFVLTSLEAQISTVAVSKVDTLKAVVDQLPNDTILTFYDDQEGVVEIHGSSLDRVSPQNYMHTLEDTGLFNFTEAKITPFDPIKGGYTKESLMYGTMKYEFTFKCTLKGHFILTDAKFLDGKNPQALSLKDKHSLTANEEFPYSNISEVVDASGTKYTLTNIKVNGTAVSSAELELAQKTGNFTVTVAANTDVEFYYSVPKSSTKDGGKS